MRERFQILTKELRGFYRELRWTFQDFQWGTFLAGGITCLIVFGALALFCYIVFFIPE